MSKQKPFYLTIFDDDVNSFEIHGPMYSDVAWTEAVCEAQAKGRHVRCSSTPAERADAKEIEAYFQKIGRQRSASPIISAPRIM